MRARAGLLLLALVAINEPALAYPIFGSESTGIRRLEEARLAHLKEIDGRERLPGEILTLQQVDLRLADRAELDLPTPDPGFTAEVRALLGDDADRYGIAVLDLSDPADIVYAEHNGDVRRNPGSVGKIAVAAALFQSLADRFGDDLDARRGLLTGTTVTADSFVNTDSHTVRMWDPQSRVLTRRPLRPGDQASLWEFLDWMMSPSSNAAASMVIKQLMLMGHYGDAYPTDAEGVTRLFTDTPRAELNNLLDRVLVGPLRRNGVDTEQFRQGSFFTASPKKIVPGTSSYATSRSLMEFLLRIEQGRIVDPFSSREIKRLLYVTERRIRYATSPALYDAAVYFKSGSLYQCAEEPGYKCEKYKGNKLNLMNSVAIVEHPAAGRELFYIVTLMSNVLRKNSAVDHQTLATRIHRLIESRHAPR